MAISPQQRAAKTRAMNREGQRLYDEYTKPAHEKVEAVMNELLKRHDVRLRWAGEWRLKGGVTEARLIAIDFGGLGFTVHIDGYKRPRHYSSRFWELS